MMAYRLRPAAPTSSAWPAGTASSPAGTAPRTRPPRSAAAWRLRGPRAAAGREHLAGPIPEGLVGLAPPAGFGKLQGPPAAAGPAPQADVPGGGDQVLGVVAGGSQLVLRGLLHPADARQFVQPWQRGVFIDVVLALYLRETGGGHSQILG